MKKKNIIEGTIFLVTLAVVMLMLVFVTEEKRALQEALNDRESVISEMGDNMNLLSTKYADLSTKLETVQDEYTTLSSSNEKIVASQDALKEKARTLSTEVQQLKADKSSLEATNKKLIGENTSLKKTKAATASKTSTAVKAKVAGVTTENKQPSRSNSSVAKTFTVTATAYTAYCAGCSGVTRTGVDLRKNPSLKLIAVDPKVIPLGTKVWVEGYGYAIAGDTGGAIKGNKIDLHMSTKDAAYKWGRRQVQIKVLN